MKGVVVLGSTGKIGQMALEVIRAHPDTFRVIGLSCHSSIDLLEEQAKEFRPGWLAVTDPEQACRLHKRGLPGVRISPEKDIPSLIRGDQVDIVINAMVGKAGVIPSIETLRAGKTLGLANKESLVIAGGIMMDSVRDGGGMIIPIDSEHSAIFQALRSGKKEEIRRIHLTMGTGPIAQMSASRLREVSMEDVMARKTWDMGTKISIDSASCVNKAFEIIEAGHLFSLRPEQIEVIVHPEYLVHSMVEFRDGSIIAELGTPDMRRYVQYALFYPERPEAKVSGFADLIDSSITFKKPPKDRFPCLGLGYQALSQGGTMPAVFHGADTAAARAFKSGRIRFTDIPIIIRKTMEAHGLKQNPTLDEALGAEGWAEQHAMRLSEEIL